MEPMVFSVLMGVSVAVGTAYSRGARGRCLDWLETSLLTQLRTLQYEVTRLRQRLKIWLGFIAVAVVMCWVAVDSLVFSIVLLGCLMGLPLLLVCRAATRRRKQIETQMADAMVTMSNAVKAGLSLAQGLEILAEESPQPIRTVFRRIVTDYRMGKPLGRVLDETRERLRSENFSLFAAALQASRESGGKLNETIQRIASSVIELERVERKITVETAQARRSSIYMAIVPLLVLVAYWFMDPQNTLLLFTTAPGQTLLAAAAALNLLAYFWARKILNPDI